MSAHGYMPGVPQSFVLTSAQPLPEPVTYADVVTAGGMITFMTQPLDEQFAGPYSVVRWRDYWDQQWEENRGQRQEGCGAATGSPRPAPDIKGQPR